MLEPSTVASSTQRPAGRFSRIAGAGSWVTMAILCVSMVSLAVVLVVAAPPEAGLVATEWRAVEPRVHAPEAVQPARVRRVGVVYDAILERERAHARPLARIRGRVGSAHGREDYRPFVAGVRSRRARSPRRLAPVVVFDAPLALLLLGEPDVEVDVEVAAERGRPGERPSHPPLVRLQF